MIDSPERPSDGRSLQATWPGYVVPMFLFMALTSAENSLPHVAIGLYVVKTVVVTVALLAFRAPWRDIRPEARVLPMAILVGLVVFVEWIVVDPLTPHLGWLGGKRSALNPFADFSDPTMRVLFLAVRFYGLVLMVPVMEELFWRSFLLRWLTHPDFQGLPIGDFSWSAFAIVAACFGLAHPEWLAAIVCACAYGLLLRQTRSLFACIVAHGVTNLALGIYVLTTHTWQYW